jgi:membrane fusion protein (multidrug efflux system)
MAAASADETLQPARPSTGKRLLRRIRTAAVPATIITLASGVVLASSRWNAFVGDRTTQTTDDAQIRADITPLSTKSSGIVSRVLVADYQRVKSGDLLVELRNDDFSAQVALATAALQSSTAAIRSLQRQEELQSSRIAQARANINVVNADLDRARLERIRQEALERDGATTRQVVEAAVADHERFRATLLGRQAELEAQRHELSVLEAQEAQVTADVKAKEAALNVALVNLDYTRIVAPTSGVVGERKVRPGQLVSAGTQVISLVGDDVWVVANFMENQVTHLYIGDPSEVTVDGIPNAVWIGRVETLSPAVGSQFSLLPPDNATGNYTKIAQRVPVKIVLLPGQSHTDRLRSGMSVIASVKTKP